ncbi:MAG: glutamine--fructose-6-phosphate transaminase (isomerizing) [Ruminococcaceae bacterium]|nr:glutamine--fructose-6-phosphate transaminase (isomerizing) [Oscillospiraceae bacterium]
MCGIIGYTGTANAIPKMMKGLSVLEYRGYDSVGIAAERDSQIQIVKCKGRIGALEEKLRDHPIEDCHCAIGHTRWATHGGPSDKNAHPHRIGAVTLVHNGIIENYKDLRSSLAAKGVNFLSETDTEVAAALINDCFFHLSDPVASIREAIEMMKGAFAFGILFEGYPGEVFAVRRGSPLILAHGSDGYYLASDMTALLPFTKEYYALKENQIVRLSSGGAKIILSDGSKVTPEWKITTMTPESAQKGGYSHFMLKEIHEQREAAVKSVSPRIDKNGLPDFSSDGIDKDFWKKIKAIQIVACGSAMHAGLVGQRMLEDLAKVPTTVHIASEFRYHPPMLPEGSLVVVISQSGETADTLAALRYAKENGVPTLAVVNAVETTIAREADRRIYTFAGPEIAVATTKGYCTQATVLWLIAAAIAHTTGKLDDARARNITQSLLKDVPAAIEKMLKLENQYHKIARNLINHEHVFYIGRGIDYALSMEAALKLKEISYIHCEAYAAGELKHGTISLIEPGTPVIAICTEKELFEKTESNIREVRSRGAQVTLICREDLAIPADSADEIVSLPTDSDEATVFAAILAIQYIAYETALLLGCDIDRPRNLAKSVTVE